MKLIVLAALAALAVTPALAAPWQTAASEQTGEELYTAYQQEPTGTALFFECYKPMQMAALGVQLGILWDDSQTYPSDVPLTFTVDGVAHQVGGFNYEAQGTDTVLVAYHYNDTAAFEALFMALIEAQQSIVVELGGPLEYSPEGARAATDWVMAGCVAP